MKLQFILILISLLALNSCLKKTDLADDNLGPAVDPIEITKALADGFGALDYNEIKATEFTSILQSQRIQDSTTVNVQQEGITVKAVTNDSEKLFLDLIVQKEEYNNGQTAQSTTQWPITLKKGNSSAQAKEVITSLDSARPPVLIFLTYQSLAFGSCYDEGKYPETCHRLVSTDIKLKVPFAAINQHDCETAANCFITAKKIEFDMISKYAIDKDGKPVRTHYTLILSKQVPFLSRVLQICTRSIYEMKNDQKILADLCYTVNNYTAALPPGPPPQ